MKFKSYDYPSDNSGFEKYKLLLKVHASPLGFVQLVQNMETNYKSTGLNSIDKYLDNLKDECCRLNNFEQMNILVDSYLVEKKRVKEIENNRLHEEHCLFIEKMKSQVNGDLLYGTRGNSINDYLWTVGATSGNFVSNSDGPNPYYEIGYPGRLTDVYNPGIPDIGIPLTDRPMTIDPVSNNRPSTIAEFEDYFGRTL